METTNITTVAQAQEIIDKRCEEIADGLGFEGRCCGHVGPGVNGMPYSSAANQMGLSVELSETDDGRYRVAIDQYHEVHDTVQEALDDALYGLEVVLDAYNEQQQLEDK